MQHKLAQAAQRRLNAAQVSDGSSTLLSLFAGIAIAGVTVSSVTFAGAAIAGVTMGCRC
jgi:hypothetical protein